MNVVPDYLPPSRNQRVFNQLAWKVEMEKERNKYTIYPDELEEGSEYGEESGDLEYKGARGRRVLGEGASEGDGG
jgi:hypothetical protein